MIRRCEPPRRRYTELCNRSGTPAVRPAHPEMRHADSSEDYWEDASVSLRSYHSWEAPSSSWLDAPAPLQRAGAENAEAKSLGDSVTRPARPCRYSFDASEYSASVKGRRCFPPPLTSCSTLSIKEGGRFVLKEMDYERPHGFLRAQRENGRLLLQLVLPDELNDKYVNAEDDDDDADEIIDCGEDEDDDDDSVVEHEAELGASISAQFAHVEHDTVDEEFRSRGYSDCLRREALEGGIAKVCDCTDGLRMPGCECGVLGKAFSCDELQDVGSKTAEPSVSLTWQDVSKEGMPWGALDGCANIGNLVAEGRFGVGQGDVLGHQQEECLWNVEPAKSVAMASHGPWLPNQICLHQPLMNMRPALGLAMS